MSENLEEYAGKNCHFFKGCENEYNNKSITKEEFSCNEKDYRRCESYQLWIDKLTA